MKISFKVWSWVGVAVLLAAAVLVCVFVLRVEPAIRVGTSVISQTLCGEAFVAGLDPARVVREEIASRPSLQLLLRHAKYSVDAQRREVTTTWRGRISAVAAFHAGYGCSIGDVSFPSVPREILASDPPAEPPVAQPNPKLEAALDRAFAEPAPPQYRQVRAIVIMRGGQVIAER